MHPSDTNDPPELLTPREVSNLFRVNPKTVPRWADAGHIRSVHTPGGHRRYYRADIDAYLNGQQDPQPTSTPAQPDEGQSG